MNLIVALLLSALTCRRLSSAHLHSLQEILMPVPVASPSKSEARKIVLDTLRVLGPLTVNRLKELLGDVSISSLRGVLTELCTQRLIEYDVHRSVFSLVGTVDAAQQKVTPPPSTEVNKAAPSFKEITIRVSPGLHTALKQYARLQQTSIESEAQHLLSEIVRMYQHTNVIPTQT